MLSQRLSPEAADEARRATSRSCARPSPRRVAPETSPQAVSAAQNRAETGVRSTLSYMAVDTGR